LHVVDKNALLKGLMFTSAKRQNIAIIILSHNIKYVKLYLRVSIHTICIYKWRRCSKKECCKQCGHVKFMGTMTKWPVQKHTEHHKTRSQQGRNRHKEITIFCVFRFLHVISFSLPTVNVDQLQGTNPLRSNQLYDILLLPL